MGLKDNRLIAIKDIIKLTGIYAYKEVIYFINKYIEGKFDSYIYDQSDENDEELFLDNSEIAEELEISRTRASKVLSNLMDFGIVVRRGRNKYKIITKENFNRLIYEWVSDSLQKEIENLNIVCNEEKKVAFFEQFDFLNGIEHYRYNRDLMSRYSNYNIYSQYDLVEFFFRNKWASISESHKEILKFTISRGIYDQLHYNYNGLRDNLSDMIRDPKQPTTFYYIISPLILHKIFLSKMVVQKFKKTDIKGLLLELAKSFKETLYELKEAMTKNKLLMMINLERGRVYNPISLLGSHVYMIINERLINPPKISFLYFYKEELSKTLQKSYLRLFSTLEERQLDIVNEKTIHSSKNEYGNKSYNASLKQIDRWNEIINKI
ncbi:MAG: hypothetical protein GF329_05350 [Candidatus Lokiarchaeota archaeon]|nr:hypothetical protein [Candidatus Lokiarchaeota archaeon]